MHHFTYRTTLALAAGVALVAYGAPQATAAPSSATLYVSPTGVGTNDGGSCAQATYSTVQAAVDAAQTGGTVIVCAGTYTESVTINTALSLQGQGAVIDAANQPYGIGIAASGSTVTGFVVKNAHADEATQAPGDGIVTGGFGETGPVASSNDVIVGNTTINNEGSGIDLQSTMYTVVANNVAKKNGVGINVANDLGGATAHNSITGNITSNNPGGCGIALADHTGTGVYDNRIVGNTARNNGLGTPSRPNASSGSGIILADPTPNGGVYNNVVQSNVLTGNGHGGFAMHVHAPGPKFTGNKLVDNVIGKNNVRTDYKDLDTTGVYVGNAGDAFTLVVQGNLFKHDKIGIFTAGNVTLKKFGTNAFDHVKTDLKHIKKYAG